MTISVSKNTVISVSSVTAILMLIGSIITGWTFVDERYAHAAEVQKSQQELRIDLEQQIIQYRIEDATIAIDRIEQQENPSKYEKRRLKSLEKDLDRYYKRKEAYDKMEAAVH